MATSKSVDRVLNILTRALDPTSESTVSAIGQDLNLPPATVYRHIASLTKAGYLHKAPKGTLVPGTTLLERFCKDTWHDLLALHARPFVEELSNRFEMTSHLGVFEEDMVTYIVKAEHESDKLFTVENKQLEGYCSGVGKMLLASLPEEALEEYLDTAPFPRLTENTLTEAEELRAELAEVASAGCAFDRQEFDEDIYCAAVPVLGAFGTVTAALSLSGRPEVFTPERRQQYLRELRDRSAEITRSVRETSLSTQE